MANAKRDFIVEKVKEVLAALDTADEKAAGKNLIAELEEDVQSIDDTLAFFCSDAAKEIFGAETAANMAETARKVKASGAEICFCPACTAGKAILDNKEALL